MMHTTDVDFRGGKREVEFEHEGDGVIVWSFSDEDVCLGSDTTAKEQDDVHEQLWNYLLDFWSGGPDDD